MSEANLIGRKARIKDHAPGYVKALWGKTGVIEILPGRYILRFDKPVDLGGYWMEVVTLNDDAFEVLS